MEYVYLVIEREFVHSDQSVYKIGRSSQENNSRIQQYPKGTQLICQLRVMDSHFLEREIIQLFKHKYIQRSDIGREYFEGDSYHMQLDIFTLISTYNFIVPNTSSLFSEFLQNHRSHMKPVLLQLVRVYKKKLLTTRIEPVTKKDPETNVIFIEELDPKADVRRTVAFEDDARNKVQESEIYDNNDAENEIEITDIIETSEEPTLDGNIEVINTIKRRVIPKHSCESCNYSSVYKWMYSRHVNSKRHLLMQNTESNETITLYACEQCSKKYTCKSGLWRHAQTCKKEETQLLPPPSQENTALTTALLETITKLNTRLEQFMFNQ